MRVHGRVLLLRMGISTCKYIYQVAEKSPVAAVGIHVCIHVCTCGGCTRMWACHVLFLGVGMDGVYTCMHECMHT